MTQALHIAKILFAVAFIVAGTVCLTLVNAQALAQPLFVGGIAWCMIPE